MTEGMRIKICGLFRPCDIDFVNAAGPDYIGFVFAKSPRRVTKEQAVSLKKKLLPSIQTVGVFVNEDPQKAAAFVKEGIIDWIQLHGQEDEAYIRQLKELTDCPLIKAFSVASVTDVDRACESSADYILLDHGAGGTGERFDWRLAGKIERPWFLAGGLNPDNIKEAVFSNALCLDVSSGVETRGCKDQRKIEACVRICREKGERYVER